MTARAVAACIALWIATARADPEADADRLFRAASQLAASGEQGERGAVDAFENLGASRPITRWTDDAWAEAARLAERAGDFARARRDHAQVIALGTDPALVRRSRAALQRLAAITGDGRWDEVAREHERLLAEIERGGDPRGVLEQLEQLVGKHAGYPRATVARLAIARGWETEGEPARALRLLRAASSAAPEDERERAGLVLARALVRHGELAEAHRVLDALAARRGADRPAIADVRALADKAVLRARVRIAMWIALAILAAVAVGVVRRDAGSWRAAGRALARPPGEVAFLLPVGAVLVGVSRSGNPLVADALLAVVIAGIAVAWLSGASLEARRARGRLAPSRALAQALLAVAAVGGATYLAVDRDRMIDLVVETWEHGPVPR